MKRLLYVLSILLALSSAAWAQDKVITGVVTGEDGKPIPGATVLVKGTATGAITDLDGKFTLSVAPDATTLVFSFIGLEKQEIAIGASTTISAKLLKSTKKLDEVVVTALGVEKKQKAIGYSQQQIGGDELRESGEQNLIEGLASKVAGVQVTSSGGSPGASSKIVIRGPSTINSNDNQPLIVLDGVPIDNSTDNTTSGDYAYDKNLSGVNNSNRALDINPDDIESVNVLKGPAAAALYGVRAGNGAIIITTKRGNTKGDKKLHVTIGASVEIDQVSQLPKLQNKYAQGTGGGVLDSVGNPSVGTYDTGDPGADGIYGTADDNSLGTNRSWGPTIASIKGKAYDHYKEFFKTSVGVNTEASISGGNDRATARLSFANLKQNGVIPNTNFNRTSVRVASDTKITDRWSLGVTADYTHSGGTKAQNGSNVSGVMLGLTRAPASADLIGTSDTAAHDPYKYASGQQRQYFYAYDNPFWTVYNNTFTDDVNRFIGNAFTTYKFTDWFDASYRLGTDVYTDQRQQNMAINSQGSISDYGLNGMVELNTKRNNELYGDLLLNFHHQIVKDFNGSVSLGHNFDRRDYQDLYSRAGNLTIPDFYNLSNGSILYASESRSTQKSTALFFDASFDYKNMLYFEATGRNEWSSTFGQKKNNFFYPSGNISFVFTELIKPNKWLSFGKIKGSIGQVGIAPPVYSSRTYFAVPNVSDGYTAGLSFPYLGQSGYGYSYNLVLGNPNLTPEKKLEYEVGTDLRFFNGRLTLDFTYYYNKTSDMIIQRPIASSSGFNTISDNSAVMRNQGIELVLGADVLKFEHNSFKWNVTFNISRNRNQVLSLAEGVSEVNISNGFSDIGGYVIAGQPYGVFYGTSWDRTSDGLLILDTSAAGGGLPLVKAQRGKVGDPNPKFLAGLRNTFSFKGITLSVLLDFRHGGDIWCGTCARLNRLGASAASADRERTYQINGAVQSGVDAQGNPTYTPYTSTVSAYDYFATYLGDGGNYATENAIFDGSWIRLREVTLSYRYNFKPNKLKIQAIDISFTGRNLWLKTKYPGVDPETSLTGASSNLGGFDYFNNPGTKSYILGFKAFF